VLSSCLPRALLPPQLVCRPRHDAEDAPPRDPAGGLLPGWRAARHAVPPAWRVLGAGVGVRVPAPRPGWPPAIYFVIYGGRRAAQRGWVSALAGNCDVLYTRAGTGNLLRPAITYFTFRLPDEDYLCLKVPEHTLNSA